MTKVFLFGRHSKRIPFSYASYRSISEKFFQFVCRPDEADIIIAGFSKDFEDESELLLEVLHKKPSLKLAILSEEPLWDSLWSGEFWVPKGSLVIDGFHYQFDVLNHVTTRIYGFQKFPYFITTSDDYFVRYANLFRRNAQFSNRDILNVWKQALIRQAHFAEKRSGSSYEFANADLDMCGLSCFRSQIAERASGLGVLRVGQGWGTETKRQALPDWHLDKLVTLDLQSFIVSSIENTHQLDYISEKIFDAFAVLGIPLYVASPEHSIHRILPAGSFINLHGCSTGEAVNLIETFEPSADFLAAYREAQYCLAKLFTDIEGFWSERRRVVEQIVKAL